MRLSSAVAEVCPEEAPLGQPSATETVSNRKQRNTQLALVWTKEIDIIIL
jgi:hypothetical protein